MTRFCISADGYRILDDGSLDLLAEQGVSEIGVSCETLMAEGVSRRDIEILGKRLLTRGMDAVTSHPPFGSYNEGFSLLRQTREGLAKDLAWMEEFLIRCGLLGMYAIPLHTGGAMLPGSQPWEVLLARRYVRRLLETAERSRVIIAIENTNHAAPVGWYHGAQEEAVLNRNIWSHDDAGRILEFVRSFRHPYVKICHDTGHSHLLGHLLEDMETYRDDTALYHLHDNDGSGNDAHLQPGYGNTPWNEVFSRIREGKLRAPLLVEAEPYSGKLSVMLQELDAIAGGCVTYMPGGFLKKDPDTGLIAIQ